MFTRGNKTNRAHVNKKKKKGIYLKERRDDTISFIVIAIVSHAPRDKRSLVEPLYISTCISRLRRLFIYTTHNEVLQ